MDAFLCVDDANSIQLPIASNAAPETALARHLSRRLRYEAGRDRQEVTGVSNSAPETALARHLSRRLRYEAGHTCHNPNEVQHEPHTRCESPHKTPDLLRRGLVWG